MYAITDVATQSISGPLCCFALWFTCSIPVNSVFWSSIMLSRACCICDMEFNELQSFSATFTDEIN